MAIRCKAIADPRRYNIPTTTFSWNTLLVGPVPGNGEKSRRYRLIPKRSNSWQKANAVKEYSPKGAAMGVEVPDFPGKKIGNTSAE